MTREEKIAELERRKNLATKDPAAFINFFCYTFNPKLPGGQDGNLPFNLFPFQEDLVKDIVEAIDTGNDLFIEKCREMGATYVVLAVFLWYWLYVPGSNFLLGSRKAASVDNRGSGTNDRGERSNKEESLFGKIEYMLDRLPAFLLPVGFDSRKHSTYMSIKNPASGNVISGESSNQNFSRGGRYKAVLHDEFAFWENDTAAWGSTADTTNCRIVITTPGIRPCKAKRLRFGTDGEKIKIVSLEYHLDPRKNAAWVQREKERRSAEDFAREIMINWDVSVVGRVYPEIEHTTIGQYPYNPDWPLYVTWDFGLDGLPVQWWQKNLKNGLWRIVESYKTENMPIQYILPLFPGNKVDSMFSYDEDFLSIQPIVSLWKRAIHVGDPDVAKRSLISKEKSSTRKELEKAGIYVQTNPKANDFATRREKTKVFLQKGIEVNDTPGNTIWMESIREARYPQRAEGSQATSAVTLPIHDWTSHHRTATEYLAVNVDDVTTEGKSDRYSKYDDYQQEGPRYTR